MHSIKKQFEFCASHKLNDLKEGHPCTRLHGHNYIVEVELCIPTSELNGAGMVLDYREMGIIKEYIDNTYDHRHLNDIVTYNPTAENMAFHFFKEIQTLLRSNGNDPSMLKSITIKETSKTSATYYAS